MPGRFATLSLLLLAAVPAAAQSALPLDRGSQLVTEHRYAEARQLLEPIARAEPNSAPVAYWLGRARAGVDDIKGGQEMMERAVALAPGNAEYHLFLGRIYGFQAQRASIFSRLGLARKCKAEFERAATLDPDSYVAKAALVDYLLAAPGFAGGSKDDALARAQALARRNPYQGALLLARVKRATKRDDEAIAGLRAAAASYPDSAAPVSLLASLYGASHRYEPAFAAVDAFLKRRPRDPVGLYALGRLAAVSRQRLDDGEKALRQLLATGADPGGVSVASIHWRLGMILEARGRREDARREYEAAVRMEPQNPEMQKALAAVKA